MLTKLLSFDLKTLRTQDTKFWINTIIKDSPGDFKHINHINISFDYSNDKYIDFILGAIQNNRTSNTYFKSIGILTDRKEEIAKGVVENSGNEWTENLALAAIKIIVSEFNDALVYCSRVHLNLSPDCSELRNIALNDENFVKDFTLNELFMKSYYNNSVSENEWYEILKIFDYYNENYVHLNDSCRYNNDRDISMIDPNIIAIFTEDGFQEEFNLSCEMCKLACYLPETNSTFEINEFITEPVRDIIYSTGLVISIIFLILTLVIFAVLPVLRANVPAKCTLFHLISMTGAFLCLALVQLDLSNNFICQIMGHIMQFGFLAMFFWLNVMCFDVMLAFCFLRNRRNNTRSKRNEVNRLAWYCCYGWGGPLLILVITLLMEYSDILDDNYSHFKPNIGGPKCFFFNTVTQWLFLYGPIGCLIFTNLTMFAITAIMIHRHSKCSDTLQSSDNSATTSSDNSRLKIYINLFILMGANWVAEVLSWTLPDNKWVHYMTDITVTLQGVFVFILFVCKPRVVKELRMKLGCLKNSVEYNNQCKTNEPFNRRDQTTAA